MFSYADGSVAQLTSVWHQVLTRESSRRLEVFCEEGYFWTDDDYLGPLHVQTSTGIETITGSLPEWASQLGVPEEFVRPVAAYSAPSKAFLDVLSASPSAAAGHPSAADALAAHRWVDRAYRSAGAGGEPVSDG